MPEPFECTISAFVRDVEEILEHLSLHDATVIGHSLGAIVASVLAIEHPERTASLVLIDPAYGRPPSHEAHTRSLIGNSSDPTSHDRAVTVAGHVDATVSQARARQVRRRIQTERMTAEVIWSTLGAMHCAGERYGIKPNSEKLIRQRALPVYSIHADSSRAAWEQAVVTDSGIDHSVVEYWPGATHFLHQDDPERFANSVQKWITICNRQPYQTSEDFDDEYQ
jgi:pimeloyl-ACP methyl ester carboxylesterase